MFLMTRSAKKKQQAAAQMRNDIQPGTGVRTIGGLYATVKEVNDDTVLLEAAPGVHLIFAKNAIGAVLSDEEYNRIVHGEDESEDDLKTDGTIVPDDASSLTEATGSDASTTRRSTWARSPRPTTPRPTPRTPSPRTPRPRTARPTARPTRSSHDRGPRRRPRAPGGPPVVLNSAGAGPTTLRGRPGAHPARDGWTGRNEKVAAPNRGRKPAGLRASRGVPWP